MKRSPESIASPVHSTRLEMRVDEALKRAGLKLRPRVGIPSPEREAILVLAAALERNEVWIRTHPEFLLNEAQGRKFESWIDRREAGEALEHILGRCIFFGRSFRVSDKVLIPRPETELMLESALGAEFAPQARILDVGCGSGCLGITMKLERPQLEVVAVDISMPALEVAQANSREHEANVEFLLGDLSRALEGHFDVVLANLPYLPTSWMADIPVELRHEPAIALDGGEDGLDLVRALLGDLPRLLAPGSTVFLEIAEGQAEAVEELGRNLGYENPRRLRDAGGCDRILNFTWRAAPSQSGPKPRQERS